MNSELSENDLDDLIDKLLANKKLREDLAKQIVVGIIQKLLPWVILTIFAFEIGFRLLKT
jgi:hypothetical protein